ERLRQRQGARQDGYINRPVFEPLAAREEPPGQEHEGHEKAGEREFIPFRKVPPDTQAGQPHDGRDQPDKQHRDKKEAEHGLAGGRFWHSRQFCNQRVMWGSCRHLQRSNATRTRRLYSFSSGKTLTSTRRFFRLCSGLLGSVMLGTGLSHPLPTTLNLFASNLYLPRMALRTESARS